MVSSESKKDFIQTNMQMTVVPMTTVPHGMCYSHLGNGVLLVIAINREKFCKWQWGL